MVYEEKILAMLEKLDSRMETLESGQAALDKRMLRLETLQAAFDGRLEWIDQGIRNVNHRKVDVIHAVVAQHGADITELRQA